MQRVQAQTAGKKTPNQTSKEREYGNLRAQDLMNDVQRDPMTGKPMLGPDKKTPLLNRGAQAELNRRMNAKSKSSKLCSRAARPLRIRRPRSWESPPSSLTSWKGTDDAGVSFRHRHSLRPASRHGRATAPLPTPPRLTRSLRF